MRKAGIILGAIVAGIALLVVLYEFGYTHRYRYRLTLEIEVDGQIKSGSGVIQVISRLDLVPGRPLKYTTTFSGEAVYIDLGPRGNLFVLLTAPDGFDAGYLPSKAFFRYPVSADREEHEQRFKELNRLVTARAQSELRPEQLPLLVTFKDVNDPKSVVPGTSDGTFGRIRAGGPLEARDDSNDGRSRNDRDRKQAAVDRHNNRLSRRPDRLA